MRNIRFKAKNLCGHWVEGDLCHQLTGGMAILGYKKKENDIGLFSGCQIIDPSTVCQFTGLKDKNGKEIWEHDLISFHEKGESCEVIFEKGRFMALNSDNIPTAIITGIEHYDRDILVLGNKFDRKEEK